jgi:hypothetical protein
LAADFVRQRRKTGKRLGVLSHVDQHPVSPPGTFRALPSWTLLILIALGLPVAAGADATSAPLADVIREAVPAAEVEVALGAPLEELERRICDMKRQMLEALLDAEGTTKVAVSEEEIETFQRPVGARFKREEAEVPEEFRAYLRNWKLAFPRDVFLRSPSSQAQGVVHPRAPPVFQARIVVDAAPTLGPLSTLPDHPRILGLPLPLSQEGRTPLRQVLPRYGEQVFPVDRPGGSRRKDPECE